MNTTDFNVAAFKLRKRHKILKSLRIFFFLPPYRGNSHTHTHIIVIFVCVVPPNGHGPAVAEKNTREPIREHLYAIVRPEKKTKINV